MVAVAEYKPMLACGWCVARLNGQPFVDTGKSGVKRDAKTGRVVKEEK
jgi:hypothetical protein